MIVRRLLTAALAVTALSLAAFPAPAAEFSDKQKHEIEQTVRDYLVANPEVLLEIMHALEAKRAEAAQAGQKAALKALSTAVEGASVPKAGNLKGDVTIVEFFDYRCSYCKRAFPHVRDVLATDRNVRVVMKEFPILSPESEVGARAALAVWKLAPEKYMAFHSALMEMKGQLSENKIMVTAAELGLKEADVRKAMADPAIQGELEATAQFAHDLNITGTPAFIIGGKVYPGYLEKAAFEKYVADARAGK